MYDLNGKVALVTGAGGRHGIGRAIATRLASEGADVVVTDVEASLDAIRTEDRLDGWRGLPSVVEEIQAMGRRSAGLYYDVADSTEVNNMVNDVLREYGRIDILVNNAGSRPGRDRVLIVELEEDAFDDVMRVNVRGTYLVSRRSLPPHGRSGRPRQNHQHLIRRRQARHRPLRSLLRQQVCRHRIHPVPGPRDGPLQGQR